MRFKVSGVYGEKFAPSGHVLRVPSTFTIHLNSERGVTNFINDMRPFKELSVYDIIENRDVSDEFSKEYI